MKMIKTPIVKHLREAYALSTGQPVEEPQGPIHEPSWVEQEDHWYTQQFALKEEKTAE